MRESSGRRIGRAALLLSLASFAALLFASGATTATTTPPGSGDWTIEAWENATLEGGSTVVAGNITVNGTLYVGNGTLQLNSPVAGVQPRLLVGPGATLTTRNAALQADSAPLSSFVIECAAASKVSAAQTTITGLGSMVRGDVSFVGFYAAGANLSLQDVAILSSQGGLGLDLGTRLTAANLTIHVSARALAAAGGSQANVTVFNWTGSLASTDYLVVADRSPLTLSNGNLSMAATGAFLLSTAASFTNVSLGPFGDLGVLLLSADLRFQGGIVAPHARGGFEAYESSLDLATTLFNFTYGAILIDSKATIHDSAFEASNSNPKGSFSGVYAFGSDLVVRDSSLSGKYFVTDVPFRDANGTILRDANGTVLYYPVFACSQSSIWTVHSSVVIDRTNTTCFNEHVHTEQSDLVFNDLSIVNGTIGVFVFRGTVDGLRLTASDFTNPLAEAAALTVYQSTGTVADFDSLGNDIGVDVIDASVRIVRMVVTPPGLGARIQSGAPTLDNCTFTVHNATAVLVRGGNPTITNSTFWISADRMNATGVEVAGGGPVITGNTFQGTFQLTYGVLSSAGAPIVTGNRFEGLERGAIFYGEGFLLEGNLFTRCWNGAESQALSQGIIRGNTFRDLRDVGFGSGVNLYIAAVIVEQNSFVNVNYGVKVFFYDERVLGDTRVNGNTFDSVEWYAIEIWNSTKSFLVDNNTIRNATHGGIEIVFSNASASYNVNYDGERYGYDITNSNVSITGDRLENVSEAVHANRSAITMRYTTVARTHLGVNVQDGPLNVYNGSFQLNGIAVEIVNAMDNEIVDSIFIGNTLGVSAFGAAHVELRDTSFIGTLGPILDNQQSSTGHILFTHRGEINGGQLKLRGVLESDAPALTLRALNVVFYPVDGGLPGISIRGASLLAVTNVGLSNSSTTFFFEVHNSTGTMTQVTMRRVASSQANGTRGPLFVDASMALKNIVINESFTAFTLVNTLLSATNLTVRDTNSSGIALSNSSLTGSVVAVLDNAYCGVNATGGSMVNVSNLTVRGNDGGGLCFLSSNGEVWNGDLSNTGTDIALQGSSDLLIVSTNVARGWTVTNSAALTVAWLLTVRVSYPNPALLPSATLSVVDAKGLPYTDSPDATGNVTGLPPFIEQIVTPGGSDVRTPYAVSAALGPSRASAAVVLTQDRLVQLDLADATPPDVTILAPADGSGFATGSVLLRFEGSDSGSGLKDLQYRFGAGALSAVPTTPGPIEFTRDLVDGVHTFSVVATDFAGNQAEASINFTVDTQAPLITLVGPKPSPYTTRGLNVTVQVTVEPDVVALTIGGANVTLLANGGNRTVELPEGTSQIVVEAVDRVGNRANITVTVACDRTPPELTVENAGQENLTVESFAVVRGRTEPGSLVLIGGFPVATQNGSFEALVLLTEGRNEIEIRSRDALGNENVTKLVLVRGTVQPSHLLDTVALLVGAGLLIAAAGVAFVTYGREQARKAPSARAPTRPREGSP